MSSSANIFGDPATRARILDAAWRIIAERGINPTLVEIAREAGVTRRAIYLHFGDRAGLFVALVHHIDETLGKDDIVERIIAAPTGVKALEKMVEALSVYAAEVDDVARILEAAQYEDEAIKLAWQDRMNHRRGEVRALIERISVEGSLADGWTVEAAADLCFAVIMPAPWRQLTGEIGWTPQEYARRMNRLLRRALISE